MTLIVLYLLLVLAVLQLVLLYEKWKGKLDWNWALYPCWFTALLLWILIVTCGCIGTLFALSVGILILIA